MNAARTAGQENLARLERELAQLQQQLPAHSIPSALLERIDELEEQIAACKRTPASGSNDPE